LLGFSVFTTLLLALFMREEVQKMEPSRLGGSARYRDHEGRLKRDSVNEFWRR
jgi:hypothetical protein